MISAQELIERMQKNVAVPWQSQHRDGFPDGILLGSADTNVREIVTTLAPTLDALRKAVPSTNNTVSCREAPFHSRGEGALCFGGMTAPKELTDRDTVCRAKQKFISKNNLVIVLSSAIGMTKNRIRPSPPYIQRRAD